MRAGLLNNAQLPTLNAGPENDPRTNPLDAVQIPVEGGVVEVRPPVQAPDGFDLAKAEQYWKTGEKLYNSGKATGMQINPGEVLTAAASGAAAGAAIAGLGAVAGAAIAVGIFLVGKLFGGNRPSQWDNAGPNVHWWFTNRAPQSYLTWIEETNNRGVFASVADSAKGLIAYWLTQEGYVIMPPPGANYSGRMDFDYVWDATGLTDFEAKKQWCRDFYANFGIDWDATVQLVQQSGRAAGVMMKNRVFIVDAPSEPGEDGAEQPTSNATAGVVLGAAALGLYLLNSQTSNNG